MPRAIHNEPVLPPKVFDPDCYLICCNIEILQGEGQGLPLRAEPPALHQATPIAFNFFASKASYLARLVTCHYPAIFIGLPALTIKQPGIIDQNWCYAMFVLDDGRVGCSSLR